MEAQDSLRELYYDPATGPASAAALCQRAKAAGVKVMQAQVREFVKSQEVSQVFKRRSVRKHFPLIAYRPIGRVQIDLTDLQNLAHWNSSTKFLCLAIDVYTRWIWIRPLRNKGNEQVLAAFSEIMEDIAERTGGFYPSQLDSDMEASFSSRDFTAYCEERTITQNFLSAADYKGTGVVDRATRSVRELLNRFLTAHNTRRYLDILPALAENMNSRRKFEPRYRQHTQ